MAKARVEFVTLGIGPNYNGRHQNVIDQLLASAAVIDVGPTPTPAGSRPTAPAGDLVHARITATTGKIIAAWGPDPTASQSNGLVVLEGASEVVPVAAGGKISLVELSET